MNGRSQSARPRGPTRQVSTKRTLDAGAPSTAQRNTWLPWMWRLCAAIPVFTILTRCGWPTRPAGAFAGSWDAKNPLAPFRVKYVVR